MIVVAGGTGRLGSLVTRDLLLQGHQVRVLTRDPARARPLVEAGADLAVGDVRRPGTLGPALRGATVVVSAVHGFAGPGRGSPATVDRDGNAHLAAAARDAGADVVLVSVLGASHDHPMELFRMKAAAERALRDGSGRWTIVRAGAFVELYEELLGAGRRRPLVFGTGDNPISFSSVRDVAAVVCEAVLNPERRGQVLDVAARPLTMNDLARALAPATAPRHVPRRVLSLLSRVGPAPRRRQAAAALLMDTIPMTAVRRSAAGVPDVR